MRFSDLFCDNDVRLVREHELKLAASLLIAQRVDEQIQVVYLFDFSNELVNICKELLWVYIVHHVDVDFMLTD